MSGEAINLTKLPRERFPMVVFYVIAAGVPFVLLISMGLYPGFWDWAYSGEKFVYPQAALEVAQRLGYDQLTSNLLERIPAAFVEPVLWAPLVYAGAPAIAAVIIVLLLGKPGAWGCFVARLKPMGTGVALNVGLKIYAYLVLLVMAVRLPAVLYFGSDVVDWAGVFSASSLYAFLVYAFLNQGGLLEELGWRTVAFPYLQDKMKSPLAASIAIGCLWSFWHLPRDLLQWNSTFLSFIEFYALFTLATISLSIIIAWFFNRLGGSVVPAVMIHGLVNETTDILERIEAKIEVSNILAMPAPTSIFFFILAITAAIFVWRAGPNLGLAPNAVS